MIYNFWGRQDVYAKRSVKRDTGKAGYYPQCQNFWKSMCHRKNNTKVNCKDCMMRVRSREIANELMELTFGKDAR